MKINELIKDLIGTWGRDSFRIEACEPYIKIVFTDPILVNKYGRELSILTHTIQLVPPLLVFEESVNRLLKLYKYLASFASSTRCFSILLIINDCDTEDQHVITVYTALSRIMGARELVLELSVTISKLLRFSERLKELRNMNVSDEEYIEYQRLRGEIERLILKGIRLAGSEAKLLNAIRLAEEAIKNTEIQVNHAGILDEAFRLLIHENIGTARLSSLVHNCSKPHLELYLSAFNRLYSTHIYTYLVATPEYSFLKNIPGLSDKLIVVDLNGPRDQDI
ncbi:hypothetical protein [Desulfurococcus amylolyticus]|nr:hypothetical protein [Desulfurococcus amylolyticus]